MKFVRTILLSLLAVTPLATQPALAAPHLELTLNPSRTVKVGTHCRFSIVLVWKSSEGDYRFSQPEPRLENLAVEETGETNEAYEKDGETWKRKEFRFKLKALQSGNAKVLPVTIHYVDSATQREGSFDTQTFEILIRPDRSKLYRATLVVFLILGFLSASVTAVRIWSHRNRSSHDNTLQPMLEDRFLSMLRVPHEASLDINSRSALKDIESHLRNYLSEKWTVKGSSLTPQEVLGQLTGQVTPEEMKTLKRIFGKLEEWSYTNESVSPMETRGLVDDVIRFIEGKRVI